MTEYSCFNIAWDTDGQDVDLPQEIIVQVDQEDDTEIQETGDVNGVLCDKISDKIGWCLWSHDYKRITPNNP